ncbi:MAG TPA: ROK family protein [Verrucomicrobiae bacterium]|nr:ROK family protein [Verrucomicrobiae bacterium]
MLIGIEIGGTKLQLVAGDEHGVIATRLKLPVDSARGAAGIREQIQTALPKLAADSMASSIGVGFGGPVDWRQGRICRSHQVEGWSEFDLGGWLRELTSLPARVDNDANVAGLGEAACGAGRGRNPVFYVTLGSGVGGGLVIDGRIYHGSTPGEAEIGHVRLDRKGTIVESRCSGWAVDARIRVLKTSAPESWLCRAPGFGQGGEARHLAAALAAGDRAAAGLLAELAEDLAFGLSHVVHLFHPEIMVLGGGLSGIGEPLRVAVEKAVSGFVMEAFAPGPRIALAALWEDAVPTGALLLAASVLNGA